MNTPNNTNKKKLDTKWIIAAIVVPLVVAGIGYFAATRGNKQTAENKTGISARRDVNISGSADVHVGDKITINIVGFTLTEYKEGLLRQEKILRKGLTESIGKIAQEKRRVLEIELKAIGEKLNNLEQSYEEEKKRNEEVIAALNKLKGELPEAVIKEAELHLQKGDRKVARTLFGSIVDKGSPSMSVAAYQSGQLAEGDIDYSEAMRYYRIAVTLEDSNPDYLFAAGTMARTLGSYREAQLWLKTLLQLREQEASETVGSAHAQYELAWLYLEMGKYEKAEPLLIRSLEITEKVLGNEHTDVAASLDILASLYWQQGKYKKAEPLYTRSLGITEKVLGKEHLAVANSLSNLANLYTGQGKYEKAEPLFLRSLDIVEKSIGKENTSIATILNNLADLYWRQGKYEKAEPLHIRSLNIREKFFGKDHPSVATSLCNVASLYWQQGKYEKAEPLFIRSLNIRESILGKEHLAVANSLSNLANLYTEQGKYEKAEPLFLRSLDIVEKSIGKENTPIATILNNLANLYRQQGKYEEAEPLYKRALDILRTKFPNGHPNIDTIESYYAIMKQSMQSDQ
ncbi:MAG: tetratricopeptide repeat protein [Deltaproteobacteria bacterium]|nr:tetratricopeptide repeat protein [Deltaproteobacteria bacterium]